MMGIHTVRTPIIMLATTCCLAGAAVAVSDSARSLITMSPTGVWFANQDSGSVSHVGPSGADATVKVNNASRSLQVIQIDGVAYATDDQRRLSRIDPVQLTVSQEALLPSADTRVVDGGGHLYAVDPVTGTVRELDRVQLTAIGEAVAVSKHIGSAVVDGNGVLWIVDMDTGEVVEMQGQSVRSRRHVTQPGTDVKLAVVGTSVTAIDPRAQSVTVISGGERPGTSNQITLGAAGALDAPALVAAGSVLPVLSDHVLTTVDVGSGTTQRIDLAPGHRLGTPRVAAGKIYIPDFTAGVLLVVDINSGKVVNTITVTGHAGTFEVVVDGERVYVNDPGSERAWTIDANGIAVPIEKYDPDHPSDAPSPTPAVPAAPPLPPSTEHNSPEVHAPPPPATTVPQRPATAPRTPPVATVPQVEVTTPPPPPSPPPPSLPERNDSQHSGSDDHTGSRETPDNSPSEARDGAVRNVVATAGEGSAEVSWQAPSDWHEVTGYKVVLSPGNGKAAIVRNGQTTYAAGRLTNGTKYSFEITALSRKGPGVAVTSNTVSPAAVMPGAPTDVTAKPGDGQVSVTWAAPTSFPASGYLIEVVQEGVGVVATTSAGAEQTSATVTGLTNGVSYHAVVRASAGNGATGSPATSPIFTPRGRPGSPSSVTASVSGPGEVTITWLPGAANGSAMTGYLVSGAGGGSTTVAGDVTRLTVGDLTIGTTYTFSVRAVNAVGSSEPVDATVMVQSHVPDAPGNVTATAGNATVTLTWTAPNGNGTAIQSYVIRNLTDVPVSSRTVDGSATSYVYSTLTNGVAYFFDVRAVGANAAVSAPGAPSPASVVPTAPPGRPNAPGAVVASTVSPTSVNVTFSQESPSNGTVVDHWKVSTSPATTTTTVTSRAATLNDLTPGTTYTISIIGIGTNGFESTPASVSATTPAGVPAALTGLVTGYVSLSTVMVTWVACVNATEYRVDPGDGTAPFRVSTTQASWSPQYAPGSAHTVMVTPLNAYGDGQGMTLVYILPLDNGGGSGGGGGITPLDPGFPGAPADPGAPSDPGAPADPGAPSDGGGIGGTGGASDGTGSTGDAGGGTGGAGGDAGGAGGDAGAGP